MSRLLLKNQKQVRSFCSLDLLEKKFIITLRIADVAELADAQASGACGH